MNFNLLLKLAGISLLAILATHPTWAASTAGGGLPYESWMTKVTNSITGPFAFFVSIVGIVSAGAALIFGGDMSGFLKSIVFLVLALSFVIAGKNTLSAITGEGALITPVTVVQQQGGTHA